MAKHKKHAEHHEEMSEAWLLPYSDLMTLLLAVFIVLFAVSQVDKDKAEAISQAFRGMFDPGANYLLPSGDSGGMIEDGVPSPIDKIEMPTETDENPEDPQGIRELHELQAMQEQIEEYLSIEGLEYTVSTFIDERGLVISLNDSILFDPGSAAIKPEVQETLIKIGNIINQMDNYIRVEGHTDNVPMNNEIYPSNWELSGARASRVVRLFIEQSGISAEKLSAIGYGEFRPVASNDTPEGRAENRHVNIILLSTKYNSLEEQETKLEQDNTSQQETVAETDTVQETSS